MHQNNISLESSLKTKINLDCVKICPFSSDIWAFSFYQQEPEFMGGIEIVSDLNTISKNIYDLGPIMHIQWLNSLLNEKYHILAACRNDKIKICSINPNTLQIQLQKQIVLDEGVFCLYCHWICMEDRIVSLASTNESNVYQVNLNKQWDVVQKRNYNKHQYAVWACRLTKNGKKFIAGDQVKCLYLYDCENGQLLEKNNKAHEEGICDIIFSDECKFLSGSFDGTIAEIDIQQFGTVKRKFNIGGTIWRILIKNNLLFICNSSQKKFQLFNPEKQTIQWDSGTEHTSLAYAADFTNSTLVTASFYDQNVKIWHIN